jgi:hypothetical protein
MLNDKITQLNLLFNEQNRPKREFADRFLCSDLVRRNAMRLLKSAEITDFNLEKLEDGTFKVACGVHASRGKVTVYAVSFVWDCSKLVRENCDCQQFAKKKEYFF